MPKIMASVVMRMGRRRTRAASSRASFARAGRGTAWPASFTCLRRRGWRSPPARSAFLRDQAHQHHHANDGEHGDSAEPNIVQRQHHADEGQGQRGHQRERLQEALELAGQDHVDEDDGHGQGRDGVAERLVPCSRRSHQTGSGSPAAAAAVQHPADVGRNFAHRAPRQRWQSTGHLARQVAPVDLVGARGFRAPGPPGSGARRGCCHRHRQGEGQAFQVLRRGARASGARRTLTS